jgi:hypothetical protein
MGTFHAIRRALAQTAGAGPALRTMQAAASRAQPQPGHVGQRPRRHRRSAAAAVWPGERMTATQASNQELVGAIAVDVLAGKGWCDDDPDCELIAALRWLFRASPVCQLEVEFNGEVLHDMLRLDLSPAGVIVSSLELIGVVVLGRVSIADRPTIHAGRCRHG